MIELVQTYWLYFLIGQYPAGPLGGLSLTLVLAAAGLVFSIPLGLLLGIARISPFPAISLPITAIVFVVRGTPLLLTIFWAYFFLPSVTGYKTNQFTTMLIALVLFNGVYLAEIFRAGILGVRRGQFESAKSLGFGYWLVGPDGGSSARVNDTAVVFNRLTSAQLDAYAACGDGIGKAGGYAIQGRAAAFVRLLTGSYSGVVGLPLFETAQLLRGRGYPVP